MCLLPALQRRSGILKRAIVKYLVPHGARIEQDECLGCYYIYVQLPEPVHMREFAQLTLERESLIVGSGETFEVHSDEQSAPIAQAMRLCIAWEDGINLVVASNAWELCW